MYRVSQKKGTNRMLLEPRCTSSITSSWHPLGLENVFCSSLTKTKQDQALPIWHLGSRPVVFVLLIS